jgi:hypothetical protein
MQTQFVMTLRLLTVFCDIKLNTEFSSIPPFYETFPLLDEIESLSTPTAYKLVKEQVYDPKIPMMPRELAEMAHYLATGDLMPFYIKLNRNGARYFELYDNNALCNGPARRLLTTLASQRSKTSVGMQYFGAERDFGTGLNKMAHILQMFQQFPYLFKYPNSFIATSVK